MDNFALTLIGFILCLLLESSGFLIINGYNLNCLLIFILFFPCRFQRRKGILWGLVGGLMEDLLSLHSGGLRSFTYTLAAFFGEWLWRETGATGISASLGSIIIVGLEELLFLILQRALGLSTGFPLNWGKRLAIGLLGNAVIAIILVGLSLPFQKRRLK